MGLLVHHGSSATASGPIRWIDINRPEAANALDVATLLELGEAIDAVKSDPNVAAVVIGAVGDRHFCAGADGREPRSEQRAVAFRQGLESVLISMVRLEKPVIAAVNGAACGAGAMVACVADYSVMAESTFLCFPELEAAVPPLLAFDLIAECAGAGLARSLVLTGRRIQACECVRHGLVSAAVPLTEIRAAATQAAATLAAKPHEPFARFKRHLADRFEPLITRAVKSLSP